MSNLSFNSIDFNSLFSQYNALQSQVAQSMAAAASSTTGASPGRFLALQFQLQNVSQLADGISNMMSQLSSIAMNSIRNFKGS
jgi:hypothetical protein